MKKNQIYKKDGMELQCNEFQQKKFFKETQLRHLVTGGR
jgi:hypothetical protein